MGKFTPLILLCIQLFALHSCTESCEKDKTGTITINNRTEKALWFDATRDDGYTTENRQVKSGSSTTYTLRPGVVNVWVSLTNNDTKFQIIDTRNLAQCANEVYSTVTQACTIFETGDIFIFNSTKHEMWFDISDEEGNSTQIRQLAKGDSTIYSVSPGPAFVWASLSDNMDGFINIASFNLTMCDVIKFVADSLSVNINDFEDDQSPSRE